MNRIRLGIVDCDADYTDGLSNYIAVNFREDFDILTYSKIEYLQTYCETNLNLDVVLATEENVDEKIVDYAKMVILLSDGNTHPSKIVKYAINKYQLPKTIVNQIKEYYSAVDPFVLTSSGEGVCKLIGIFSPSGGVGKTQLAIGLAIERVARGMSALYLNLESIPSIDAFLPCHKEHSLSKVLYTLKNGGNLAMSFDAVKAVDPQTGVEYFTAPESLIDLEEVSLDEFETLFQMIKQSTQYDYVFIDLSSAMNKRMLSLMNMFDENLVIFGRNDKDVLGINRYQEEILKYESNYDLTLHSKSKYVLNDYNNSKSDNHFSLKLNKERIIGNIPYLGATSFVLSNQSFYGYLTDIMINL